MHYIQEHTVVFTMLCITTLVKHYDYDHGCYKNTASNFFVYYFTVLQELYTSTSQLYWSLTDSYD